MPLLIVCGMAIIKRSCAIYNKSIEKIDGTVADAIVKAADEVVAGDLVGVHWIAVTCLLQIHLLYQVLIHRIIVKLDLHHGDFSTTTIISECIFEHVETFCSLATGATSGTPESNLVWVIT